MGTRPRPRQAAEAATGGDGARKARTGPRLTRKRCDIPATPRLRRGPLLTTLHPTKRQPATDGAVERGGRVTTERRTLERRREQPQVAAHRPHTHAVDALRHLTVQRELLFIGTRFSNLYTAVDTPAEAA
jgi:hypothetical protein